MPTSRASFVLLCLIGLVAGNSLADDIIDRETSKASPWKDSLGADQVSRLDFDFGDSKALLRRDGTWEIQGSIHHRGFTCGNYRYGIRFGRGNPDCVDVQWVTETVYTISQKFCNNAERLVVGQGFDTILAVDFERLSCAERLIRCRGKCQADGGPPEYEPPRFGGYR